jgi:hypothetical protein
MILLIRPAHRAGFWGRCGWCLAHDGRCGDVGCSRRAFRSGDLAVAFVGGRLGLAALSAPQRRRLPAAGVPASFVALGPIAIDAPTHWPPTIAGALLGVAFTRSMLVMLAICHRGAAHPARIRSEHHPVPSPGSATSSLSPSCSFVYVM